MCKRGILKNAGMDEGYKRLVDFNDRREDGEVRGKVIIQRQMCL